MWQKDAPNALSRLHIPFIVEYDTLLLLPASVGRSRGLIHHWLVTSSFIDGLHGGLLWWHGQRPLHHHGRDVPSEIPNSPWCHQLILQLVLHICGSEKLPRLAVFNGQRWNFWPVHHLHSPQHSLCLLHSTRDKRQSIGRH